MSGPVHASGERAGRRVARLRRTVLLLAFGLLAARMVFLMLSPFELAADEAHYWDWSRRLDLSYYSKGPGIAWLIRAATWALGSAEWAVRTPAALAGCASILLMAGLGASASGGGRLARARAGAWAAAAFCTVPAFHATALFVTIDGPYIACWIASAWAGWAVVRRARAGRPTVAAGVALGAALGAGFLFKYTILLLGPGLLLYLVLDRRELGAGARPRLLRGGAAAVLVGVLVASPVAIWNAGHDWPTVRHLLGHLGLAAGDVPTDPGEGGVSINPVWTLELLATQLGVVGPAAVLMWLGVRRSRRRRRREAVAAHGPDARLFLASCAAPILVFYLGVSLVSDAEANWPIAGYTTLLALVGLEGPARLRLHGRMVRAWRGLPRPRPKRGVLGRRPETAFQVAWHWAIGYGGGAAALILLSPLMVRAPGVGDVLAVHRLMGQRVIGAELSGLIARLEASSGRPPAVIAKRYTTASLAAYYARRPDGTRPIVRSAATRLGERASSYDYFDDTRLDDPAIAGGPAVFLGSSAARIGSAFEVGPLETTVLGEGLRRPVRAHVTARYLGPRNGGDP